MLPFSGDPFKPNHLQVLEFRIVTMGSQLCMRPFIIRNCMFWYLPICKSIGIYPHVQLNKLGCMNDSACVENYDQAHAYEQHLTNHSRHSFPRFRLMLDFAWIASSTRSHNKVHSILSSGLSRWRHRYACQLSHKWQVWTKPQTSHAHEPAWR